MLRLNTITNEEIKSTYSNLSSKIYIYIYVYLCPIYIYKPIKCMCFNVIKYIYVHTMISYEPYNTNFQSISYRR